MPPGDGWTLAPTVKKRKAEVTPPPSMTPGGQCVVALTVRRGAAPFNPVWREELYGGHCEGGKEHSEH